MSIFQKSVLNKYLNSLDDATIDDAWQKYTAHFHNKAIQDNIRKSKEEQYQRGFLVDLFVNVLGYTINPEPNFNLTTELKNAKGAKKVDGAILEDGNAVAVIELKGMNTKDLAKVESQAFGYKNNQPHAVYVVTSNFQKLRFYIDKAIEFEAFNLFELTKNQFKLLWLCLSKESLLQGIPKKIKEESLTVEETVTKKLYKDYSAFKNAIFNDLITKNPTHDKLTLYKKTQKLLDRFLFIFFAEDKGLLPPNSIRAVLKQWNSLKDLDAYTPLYERYKKYFGYLNTGHKGKQHDIFAYNGGLFAPDDVLDAVNIDDDILYKHTLKLSDYDFDSEVSVNILGHIFEHSLNEIEEITAQLEGKEIDAKKTKRKKDGVFYTPKYITKYIVDNTVGKLCIEKKQGFSIDEAEYTKDRKGRTKKKLKELNDNLEAYRAWLTEITICDPACGSGAFLNQALEFLMTEHAYIDELQAALLGGGIVFKNVKNVILENNLYGVDINDESVEIAKLSLWLRTAEKGRKLTSLSNNLKVGNSLIDDPEIDPLKAFNWEQEFPKVFENGGFDVVVGNPPYVQLQKLGEESKRLKTQNYHTYERTGDLYALFYEKGFSVLKNNGVLSFITGSAWIRSNYGKSLRAFFQEKTKLYQIIDFSDCTIFTDATVLTSIVSLKKTDESTKIKALRLTKKDQEYVKLIDSFFAQKHVELDEFSNSSWVIPNKETFPIKSKVIRQGTTLKNWDISIYRGVLTGYNDAFIIDEATKNKLIVEDPKSSEIIKPILRGRDIQPYRADFAQLWIIGTHNGYEKHNRIDVNNYPSIKRHLDQFIVQITKRYDKGMTPYNLRNCAYYSEFEKPKIIYPNMTKFLPFMLDTKGFYTNQKCYILTGKHLHYLVCLFNSKLFRVCFEEHFPELQGNTREMNKVIFKELPIKQIDTEAPFIEPTKKMIDLNEQINIKRNRFLKRVIDNFEIDKVSNKLMSFYQTDFKSFVAELKKKKIKLTLIQQDEWEEYFIAYKKEINKLQQEISLINQEINKLIYELYGLTKAEIQIVEAS